jgi:ubiquinone/menaquinone biosynthesis C-methylase UbiE
MKKEFEYQREREKALTLGNVEGKELLDIGTGPLSIMAVTQYDCYVTTIDTSQERLDELEREAEKMGIAEKISFECEDASDLSYCDEAFDIVICFCSLHHIDREKRENVVAEINRVAFERVVIVELNPSEFQRRHSTDSFQPVDLKWLEETLSKKGMMSKHEYDSVSIYILEKS